MIIAKVGPATLVPGGGSPGGSADGDLGGNYPAPTVIGIGGYPVDSAPPEAGDHFEFDGTTWRHGPVPVVAGMFVPTLVPSDEEWTIAADRQAVWRQTIVVEGSLVVAGALVEVH